MGGEQAGERASRREQAGERASMGKKENLKSKKCFVAIWIVIGCYDICYCLDVMLSTQGRAVSGKLGLAS
jgi:hypothetical protein